VTNTCFKPVLLWNLMSSIVPRVRYSFKIPQNHFKSQHLISFVTAFLSKFTSVLQLFFLSYAPLAPDFRTQKVMRAGVCFTALHAACVYCVLHVGEWNKLCWVRSIPVSHSYYPSMCLFQATVFLKHCTNYGGYVTMGENWVCWLEKEAVVMHVNR